MRSEKPICDPPRLSAISPSLPLKRFQCSSDRRWPSRPFKGRSSSASAFYASLLQAIDGVMPLALCPQGVSQASQHFKASEKQATCKGCFSRQVCLLGRFPSLRHVQGSTPTGVFEGGCRPSTHSSPGFPFHFSLFVANSLNL